MWQVYDIAFGAGVGWGGFASQQVPARWGQAPIYCNQASTVEQFQLHMNQRKCEPKRMRDSKMCFYHICACRHTTKIMCAPRGSPTIKWNQDGAARAGKIQAFSTPPSLPPFKGHWWYLFDPRYHQFLTLLQARALQMWSRGTHEQHVTCHFFNKSIWFFLRFQIYWEFYLQIFPLWWSFTRNSLIG